MILINLLPHRAEKRKRRKQAFFAAMGASAFGGLLVGVLWYGYLQQMISVQQERNAFMTAEIAKLDLEIKDIATLRAEIEALKARQKAVEDLQTDRNMPVYLLSELVRQVPEGVYLSSIRQENLAVTVVGVAQSMGRVSELLRNTAYNSEWLERPELAEVKATMKSPDSRAGSREQKRLYEFSMKVALKKPQDPAAKQGVAVAAKQS